MFIVKMDYDKNLEVVRSSTIYKGESNADKIRILIPHTYNEHELNSFTNTLYIRWNKTSETSHELNPTPSVFVGYSEAEVDIGEELTVNSGAIEAWLIFTKEPNVKIKTGHITLYVKDRKIINQVTD